MPQAKQLTMGVDSASPTPQEQRNTSRCCVLLSKNTCQSLRKGSRRLPREREKKRALRWFCIKTPSP